MVYLGGLNLKTADAESITIDAVVLDAIIAKANEQLSTKDTPFTINDLFLGVFGAKKASDTEYINVPATNVIPTLANGVYTFDVSAVTVNLDLAKKAYVSLLVGGVDTGGGLDLTRRKFATDSAALVQGEATEPVITYQNAVFTDASNYTVDIPLENLTDAGKTANDLVGKGHYGGEAGHIFTVESVSVNGGIITAKLAAQAGSTVSGIELVAEASDLTAGEEGAIFAISTNKVKISLEL